MTVGEQVDIVSVKRTQIDGGAASARQGYSLTAAAGPRQLDCAGRALAVHVCILAQRFVCVCVCRLYGDVLE